MCNQYKALVCFELRVSPLESLDPSSCCSAQIGPLCYSPLSATRLVGVECTLPDAVSTSSHECNDGKEEKSDENEDSKQGYQHRTVTFYHDCLVRSLSHLFGRLVRGTEAAGLRWMLTHVSIQLITTSPFTILHLSKASPAFPQLMGRVKAVSEAEPMRKRMKAIATGTMCANRPKATWCPMKKNPGKRITRTSQLSVHSVNNCCSNGGGKYFRVRRLTLRM